MTYEAVEQLKAKIKVKHGSIAKFAKNVMGQKVDDRGYCELAALFAACRRKITPEREYQLEFISLKLKESKKTVTETGDFSLGELLRFKRAIENLGGMHIFCSKHRFKRQSVYEIMNGTRVRKTRLTNRMFKAVGI